MSASTLSAYEAKLELLKSPEQGGLRDQLEALVGLGTYFKESDDLTMEAATMRSACALLRAVAIALVQGNAHNTNDDLVVEFNEGDGARACAAIAVLLEQGAAIASDLRYAEPDDADADADAPASAVQS
ncbi:MAG TPA: hypothetical protein VGI10_19125 [Polyangiaceae bacterium]